MSNILTDKPLTKFQLAKIVVSALRNMNYVCTTLDKPRWKDAIVKSRQTKEKLIYEYGLAVKVLAQRGIDIEDWKRQSVEGEQI